MGQLAGGWGHAGRELGGWCTRAARQSYACMCVGLWIMALWALAFPSFGSTRALCCRPLVLCLDLLGGCSAHTLLSVTLQRVSRESTAIRHNGSTFQTDATCLPQCCTPLGGRWQ
jgi:hypothetical protein